MKWSSVPFVRLVVPFGFGIIAEVEWQLDWPGMFGPAFLLTFLLIGFDIIPAINSKFTRRHWHGFLVYPILFLSGYFLALSTEADISPLHYSNQTISPSDGIVLKVTGFPIEKSKSMKYEADVVAFGDSLQYPATGRVLLYISKLDSTEQFVPGDYVLTDSELRECPGPKNPGEFNYKKYLKYRGITDQIVASPDRVQLLYHVDPPFKFNLIFKKWQNYLVDLLKSVQIPNRELGVLSALVIGNRDLLDKETFQSYSVAGAMHVLAVSGLHVGLFYVVILWILDRTIGRQRWRWFKFILVLLGLWVYAGVTGFSPSVSRAATMFSFVALGNAIDRRHSIYNTLAMSAFCLLIYNPRILFEVGFQLSYLAVLGIVFMSKRFIYLVDVSNPWLDKVWQLMCVSFSAQLATFPLGLLYFHQFPTYFLFSNLFVIPAATLLLYLTLLFFVVSPIAIVKEALGWVLGKLSFWLNECVVLVERLPFAQITGISISVFEVYMVYGFIVWLTLFFSGVGKRYFFLSALCLVVIVAEEAWESYELNHSSIACFHSINNTVAITAYQNGSSCFLYSDSLYFNKNKMSYHVGHFWDDLELDHPYLIDIDKDSLFQNDEYYWKRPLLMFGSEAILMISNKSELNAIDLFPEAKVYLHGKNAIREFLKLENVKWPEVLITNSGSKYYHMKLDSLAVVHDAVYIPLAHNGYYQIRSSTNH